MANYYTQTSFTLNLPKEALDELIRVMESVDDEGKIPELPGEYFGLPGALREAENELWLSDDGESFNAELVADATEYVMKKFSLPGGIGFEWANTCSRARLDSFSGGACVVTKDGQEWMSTSQWISQELNELNGE